MGSSKVCLVLCSRMENDVYFYKDSFGCCTVVYSNVDYMLFDVFKLLFHHDGLTFDQPEETVFK